MRRYLLLILPFICLSVQAVQWDWWPIAIGTEDGRQDSLTYDVGLAGLASSGTYAPFWLQSGQHGRIAESAHSGYITATIEKQAGSAGRWWDYDAAIDLSGSVFSSRPEGPLHDGCKHFPYFSGSHSAFLVNRLYAHARLYVIDITAGVNPYVSPLPEPNLSTGSLLFSGNAMPMPRISIGIDNYMPVPGLFGYLEIKGHLSHGWITDDAFVRGALLHYKYVGARAGGNWPVNISYEFHHVAQWGGQSPVYGDLGNSFSAYMNAFFAMSGGSMENDQLNAQGNHLCMQQAQLDIKHDGWKASLYWQQFFEDNSTAFLGAGTNLPDGLWGVTLSQSRWPFIQAVCVEYLGTTDQSGPFHDQDGIVYAGNDSYYQNSIYQSGWNYFYRTIGTPFITSPLYNTNGELQTTNNRTKVWHAGLRGDIYGFRWRMLASFARNYGSYHAWQKEDIYAIKSSNTALLLEVNKTVEKAWGLTFGAKLACDLGTQFGNNVGAMITISKKGLIKAY